MKTKNFNNERGLIALPAFIGLAFMAVALAVGIGLVQRNQNLQNRATSVVAPLGLGQGNCFQIPCQKGLVCNQGKCVSSNTVVEKQTCKALSGSCKRYNVLIFGGSVNNNQGSADIKNPNITGRCPSGLEDVGQTSDCKGLAQTCCVPKPKIVANPTPVVPIVGNSCQGCGTNCAFVPVGLENVCPAEVRDSAPKGKCAVVDGKCIFQKDVGSCGWCGNSCVKNDPNLMRNCVAVLPPKDKVCTVLNDGTCAIKALGGVVSPPTTSCAWCGSGCKEIKNNIALDLQCPTVVNIAAPIDNNTKRICTRLNDGTCGIKTVTKEAPASSDRGFVIGY